MDANKKTYPSVTYLLECLKLMRVSCALPRPLLVPAIPNFSHHNLYIHLRTPLQIYNSASSIFFCSEEIRMADDYVSSHIPFVVQYLIIFVPVLASTLSIKRLLHHEITSVIHVIHLYRSFLFNLFIIVVRLIQMDNEWHSRLIRIALSAI